MTDLPESEVHIGMLIEAGTIVMKESDALVDVERPEDGRSFTADDVVAELQKSGSKSRAIDDWNLVDDEDYRFVISHKRWTVSDEGELQAVITRAEW